MSIAQSVINKRRMRGALYLLNFIFSIQMGATAFYVSNFIIKSGVSEKIIGNVYVIASIASIIGLFSISAVLNKFGNYKTIIAMSILEGLSFVGYALNKNTIILILLFIMATAITSILILSLDLFVEGSTKSDETTGRTRGIYLTASSAAFVTGPFIGGYLIQNYTFSHLFLFAASLMIPFVIIATKSLKKYKDPKYKSFKPTIVIKSILNSSDLRNVFFAQFLLRFFYATMVVYTPIYLTQKLGFTFEEIGFIFSIMLIPFVILEIPVAKLADQYIGEKEMMILGFIIISITTYIFSSITLHSIALFAGILFATRVGASIVTVTTESYFFKHIDNQDSSVIGAFRALYPLAYILAPALASVILTYTESFTTLFVTLSMIMITGVYFAMYIHDTR